MGDKTGIEWTEATWNPVTGCDEVTPGCDHCYAKTLAERFRGTPGHYFERGFDVQLRPHLLDQPLRWKRSRRIFVNSMSDLFHKDVPDSYIAQVFAVMALAPQHTFQLLTKRHGRMWSLLNSERFKTAVAASALQMTEAAPGPPYMPEHLVMPPEGESWWPLPNVWVGVSVEDQQRADLRIPALLETPAAVRFLSCEPLLGPVSLKPEGPSPWIWLAPWTHDRRIDWVIVGGESGRGARPMHPVWARSLRDQCEAAGVPFLFKQWGDWIEDEHARAEAGDDAVAQMRDPDRTTVLGNQIMRRLGKKAAGRHLDGVTHDGYPSGGDA